jgi:uncharacterized protein YndB with AHSA1/START domain
VGGVSCLVGSNPTLSAVTEPSENLMLEIDRLLSGPVDVVFAAASDPDELRKWWGPKGFVTPSLTFRPSVGETYRIEMQPPEGDSFHVTGEFREVDPPVRLAYTFVWEPPDRDDVETLVELSFRDSGGATELSLAQGPFKTEERRTLHRDGWTESLERLEAMLTGQSEGPGRAAASGA